MTVCNVCGTENKETAKFCLKCGHKLEKKQEIKENQCNEEKETDILYICRKLNGTFSWMRIDSDGEEEGGNLSAILGEAVLGLALLGQE